MPWEQDTEVWLSRDISESGSWKPEKESSWNTEGADRELMGANRVRLDWTGVNRKIL